MKFPKFIKNSYTPQRATKSNISVANSAVSTILSHHQLLLTDDICRFQPQKVRNTPIGNKENYDVCDSVAAKSVTTTPKVVKIKSAPFVETNSFLFVKETPTNKPSTPKLFQIDANLAISGGSRFVKSSQPKRLQRNRLQNSSKPANYELRSAKSSTTSNTPAKTTEFIIKSKIQTRSSRTNILEINQTPVRCLTSTSNLFHELNDNNVITIATPTPVKPQSEGAFSKLSKFVSRSALKLSRKSLDAISHKKPNSNCSSPSSSMNTSSCSSSANTSMNTASVEANENIYNYIDERFIIRNEQPESQPEQQPASIYQSLEQEEMFKLRLNQQINQMKQHYKLVKPVMGVSSLMLKQYKKNNPLYQSSLGVYSSSYLVNMPVVFKSDDEYSTSSGNSSCSFKSNYSTSTNNYDHLSRVQQSTLQSVKNNQRSITTSDLSTSNCSSISKLSSNSSTSLSNCRITIFNGNLAASQDSSSSSSSSAQYDSIQETVF